VAGTVANEFAERFYTELTHKPIGQALLAAKLALVCNDTGSSDGTDEVSRLRRLARQVAVRSYCLFANPDFRLLGDDTAKEDQPMSDGSKQVLVFSGSGNDFDLLDENRQIALPVSELRDNLAEFMASLQELLPAADKTAAGLGLKSVTVAVGINGKGKVGFLGTGVEVGGSATLTLTFERG